MDLMSPRTKLMDELDVTRDKFNVPRDEFDVTKDKLDVTRDELDVTKDEFDVTRDEFDIFRAYNPPSLSNEKINDEQYEDALSEEGLERFEDITGLLEWVYTHAGKELKLDACAPCGLVLEDRADAKSDIALVNKACDLLVDELRIPPRWQQEANKGLVCNEYGRWVRPRRDPEDIPWPAKKH
ncbi:hypothetical protein CDL15_Pgr006098 [Punica granatum]|uniref:Uncharacterized protein n=1 Tax=Punica granatum TaxID=22663 RepID=A0A218VTX6_PUNGR|nr:hypothetical protein CDL15_Pgr006098 [Punica granatum]